MHVDGLIAIAIDQLSDSGDLKRGLLLYRIINSPEERDNCELICLYGTFLWTASQQSLVHQIYFWLKQK